MEDVFCRLNLTVNFWIIWILFTLEAFYIRPEKKCYQKRKEAAKEVAEIMYPEFCKKILKQEFRKVCFVICTTVLQLIYYWNRFIRTVIYRKNAGQVVCSKLSVQIYIQTWLRITLTVAPNFYCHFCRVAGTSQMLTQRCSTLAYQGLELASLELKLWMERTPIRDCLVGGWEQVLNYLLINCDNMSKLSYQVLA